MAFRGDLKKIVTDKERLNRASETTVVIPTQEEVFALWKKVSEKLINLSYRIKTEPHNSMIEVSTLKLEHRILRKLDYQEQLIYLNNALNSDNLIEEMKVKEDNQVNGLFEEALELFNSFMKLHCFSRNKLLIEPKDIFDNEEKEIIKKERLENETDTDLYYKPVENNRERLN